MRTCRSQAFFITGNESTKEVIKTNKIIDLESLRQSFLTGVCQPSCNHTILQLQDSDEGWEVSWRLLAAHETLEVRFSAASLLHSKLRQVILNQLYPLNEEFQVRKRIVQVLGEESKAIATAGRSQQVFNKLLQCQALSLLLHRDDWVCPIQNTFNVILTVLGGSSLSSLDTIPDATIAHFLRFLKTLTEEAVFVTTHSTAVVGLAKYMAAEDGFVRGLLQHVLTTRIDQELLSTCIQVASEWVDIFCTDQVLAISQDLIDAIFHLMLTTSEIYVVGCDAITAILNSGHCGLEGDASTVRTTDHLLNQIVSLRPVLTSALLVHANCLAGMPPSLSNYDNIIGSTISLLATISELQMTFLMNEVAAESNVVKPFFSMLLEAFNVAGCYPVDEAYSALLFDAWFAFQTQMVEMVHCYDENGNDFGAEVLSELKSHFFQKLLYPSNLETHFTVWSESERDQWHGNRREIIEAYLTYLEHPNSADWVFNLCQSTMFLFEQWKVDSSKWRELEAMLFTLCGISENIVQSSDTFQKHLITTDPNGPYISTKQPIDLILKTVIGVAQALLPTAADPFTPQASLISDASLLMIKEYSSLLLAVDQVLHIYPNLCHYGWMADLPLEEWIGQLIDFTIACLCQFHRPDADYNVAYTFLWLKLVSRAAATLNVLLERSVSLSKVRAESVISALCSARENFDSLIGWCQPICGRVQCQLFTCFGRIASFIGQEAGLSSFEAIYLSPLLDEWDQLADSFTASKVSGNERNQISDSFRSGFDFNCKSLSLTYSYLKELQRLYIWSASAGKLPSSSSSSSSSRLEQMLMLMACFIAFFRGLGDQKKVDDNYHYTIPNDSLTSANVSLNQQFSEALLIKIMKSILRASQLDHYFLIAFEDILTNLCKAGLNASFGSINDDHSILDLDIQRSLFDVLIRIVRIGLSSKELIFTSLPLAWQVLQRLAVDSQPVCEHRYPVFSEFHLIEVSVEILSAINNRIRHHLSNDHFHQLSPITLASQVHNLTEEFQRFSVFFGQLANWEAPCCLETVAGGILGKLPVDSLFIVTLIASASFCLPELETFKAGVSTTQSLLPILHRSGILNGALLFRLNASLLVMLIQSSGGETAEKRRFAPVATIFAKLFELTPAVQVASLKQVLAEGGELDTCFAGASIVDRSQLLSMLTQSRQFQSASVRALRLFVEKCS